MSHSLKTIPIVYSGSDVNDSPRGCEFIYYYAKFTEDFGPFKAGDTFSSIVIDYEAGKISALDENDNVKTSSFRLADEG